MPTSWSRLWTGTKIERGIVKCRSQLFLLAKDCPDYLGGADRLRPYRSEIDLFRDGKGVINFNAEVPDGPKHRSRFSLYSFLRERGDCTSYGKGPNARST